MIEHRPLGLSGLSIPVVGLGTWRTFDVVGKESQSARAGLVSAALEGGATLFDTSPMYGEAERVLGATLTGRRERAVVASKVWSADTRVGHKQIDRTLYYFEDRVEIFQVHNLVNWQVFLPVLHRMKSSGSISAVGITHGHPNAFSEMADIMQRGLVDSIQVPYDPLRPEARKHILPLARDLSIGVIVMQPFHESVALRKRPSDSELRSFQPFGVFTWPQVILKWIVSDPRITAVVPATRSPHHLKENLLAGQPPWFGREERLEVQRLAAKYYHAKCFSATTLR